MYMKQLLKVTKQHMFYFQSTVISIYTTYDLSSFQSSKAITNI